MKKIFYLIPLFLLSCSNKNNSEITQYKDIVLGESFYSNGHIKIRVTKGRTLGEDTYLKIVKFDSLGKKLMQYGSWHYGRKFKSTYKYNSDGTLSEKSLYSFDTLDNSIIFENYTEAYHDYKLDDTTENYHGYISSKILRKYISDTIVEQYLELDSFTGSKKFIIIRTDTILKDEISY